MGGGDEPIDFVVPWVDGGDPAWQAEKDRHAAEMTDEARARWLDGAQRYRDWGFLKYWFRGVEKFAPWVNKVHFVTWGHLPGWLDAGHPKLHVVNHSDFIPAEYLPTFSSRCIDLNLHRIPGLAERFVYFNDDTFLTAPTKPSDFFRGGLPCDAAIISPIYLKDNGVRAEINALYVINERFRKRDVIRANPMKWFSPRYGTALVRTLTQLPYGLFTGFYVHHLPVSYLKSTFAEVWARVPEVLSRACAHRFRDDRDVNQWIMQYWQYCTGTFAPRSPKAGSMYEGAGKACEAAADIASGRHKMLCWNDAAQIDADAFESMRTEIDAAFAAILPERSSFERT